MICPNCSEKIRNRIATHTCSKCRYQFTFLPNEEAGLTDTFFIKKLKAISSDNAYYFTGKQLYYFLVKAKAQEKSVPFLVLGFVISFVSLIPLLKKSFWGVIFMVLGISLIIFSRMTYRQWRFPYDIKKFYQIVISKWELQRGKIEKLLPDNDLSFNLSKHNDIMDYSFDSLIITGDNKIANFLIKNDFHFKNKTAIVSYKKYPNHLFPYVIDQIKKNQQIPVFLVHNADIIFADMKKNIEKNWFNNEKVIIFDLGLHPAQVMNTKKVISQKRDNVSGLSNDLSAYKPKEQDWLKAGFYTDLAIIPPLKLLNILEYAVNTYKEKGSLEFEKVIASIFLVGLGLPRLKNGFEVDFGDDFG